MGLTLIAIGQLADAVLEAALAAARRFTTHPLNLGEGSDKNRLADSHFFEAAIKHAADIARMTADAHEGLQSDIAN